MRQRYGFRFHALRVTILCMASKGLRRTEKQITVTSPLPRRPGRPKGTHRKTSSVIRIPDELVRKCRDSLIEAKLAGGDVSTSDAVRMLAELGANVVSGELVVVNKDTWRQASLEVSQRAALQTAAMLGVAARINAAGEVVLSVTESISPGEVTVQLPEETLHKLETAVKH